MKNLLENDDELSNEEKSVSEYQTHERSDFFINLDEIKSDKHLYDSYPATEHLTNLKRKKNYDNINISGVKQAKKSNVIWVSISLLCCVLGVF